MRDKNNDVRRVAVWSPNATPEVLLIAMEDKVWYVRETAKEAMEKNPLLSLQVAALQGKSTS